jgi:hypothetical protein
MTKKKNDKKREKKKKTIKLNKEDTKNSKLTPATKTVLASGAAVGALGALGAAVVYSKSRKKTKPEACTHFYIGTTVKHTTTGQHGTITAEPNLDGKVSVLFKSTLSAIMIKCENLKLRK